MTHSSPHLPATRGPASTRVGSGRYVTLEALGTGAMGTVFRGRDRVLDRAVAIKRIHPHLAAHRLYASAFRREARAAAKITHRNVVRVLDAGRESDGSYMIVMDLHEDPSLAELLLGEPRPPLASAVSVVSQLLLGLEAVHECGIVHRDVKPENVLIERAGLDGWASCVARLCDFGIARVPGTHLVGEDGRPATFDGTRCGTLGYMAPEQFAGARVDHRADLYAAGMILHEMVTGYSPRPAESSHEPSWPRRPPRASELCPDIDPRLAQVIERAIQVVPEQRYASARAMHDALLAASEAASAASPVVKDERRSGWRRFVLPFGLVAGLLLSAATLWVLWDGRAQTFIEGSSAWPRLVAP